MEILPISQNYVASVKRSNTDKKDIFDLDITTIKLKEENLPRELITSKSLCTPGCGNTGTGNSYCCTC